MSRYLLRLGGEICTKRRPTRLQFLRRLVRNLHDAVGEPAIVRQDWSRIWVETERPDAVSRLTRVFGVHAVADVERRTWSRLEDIVEAGTELFRDEVAGRRFAVRARRSDRRRIPFASADLERALGTRLLEGSAGVDLSEPEVTVPVEIHPDAVYFSHFERPGPAGLPVGAGGRALALVSGGFDSAVAAWLMMKRGLALDYLFLDLGGERHLRGVLSVMQVLATDWSFGYRPRLWAIDAKPMVARLKAETEPRLWQVLLKRIMYRAGAQLAERRRLPALVTGEAVGQVSSQTIHNLATIESAVSLPVLRPLVGFNKDEILDLARHIGTYEPSARVPEYCALDARPTTRARLALVEEEEAKLGLGELVALIEQAASFPLRDLALTPDSTILETTAPPDDAILVDVRARTSFDAWHLPGAVHLDYGRALPAIPALDRSRPYVFYCEVGLKSAHLAELLREVGGEAYHFADLRAVMTYARERGLDEPALAAPVAPS